jgi:hypothetical protein
MLTSASDVSLADRSTATIPASEADGGATGAVGVRDGPLGAGATGASGTAFSGSGRATLIGASGARVGSSTGGLIGSVVIAG